VLTAIALVRATRAGLATVGPRLAEIDGVAEVYTVTGEWDFIAILRVREHDELATIVTHQLNRLDGIERTHTMVAFQQHSRHDLEAMFGLGQEG
jgi:DNA-binding Lrp family transcriptional regulator